MGRAVAVSTLAGPLVAATPVELDWQAPGGCPARDHVVREVSELVGTAPAEPLRARALVTRDGETFRVVIHLEGAASGVRTLHAGSCASAARATALILALAIDPQAAVLSERRREPLPAPHPPDETTPQKHPAKPLPSPRPVARAAFLVERALLPEVAAGIDVAAGIEWPLIRAELAVGLFPSASTDLDGDPSVSGDFTLAFVALRGCAGPLDAPLGVAGCATLRGSRVWARGRGASPSFEHTAHMLSLEPGALVRFPGTSALAAELGGHLVLPLLRPRFVIEDAEDQRELFRPSALGVVVQLGVSYRF